MFWDFFRSGWFSEPSITRPWRTPNRMKIESSIFGLPQRGTGNGQPGTPFLEQLLRIAYEDVRHPGLRIAIRTCAGRIEQRNLRFLQSCGFANALLQQLVKPAV